MKKQKSREATLLVFIRLQRFGKRGVSSFFFVRRDPDVETLLIFRLFFFFAAEPFGLGRRRPRARKLKDTREFSGGERPAAAACRLRSGGGGGDVIAPAHRQYLVTGLV